MTRRRGSAVIVKATTTNRDGEVRTTHYGPFLPHVGSATTSFIDKLEHELVESGCFESWEMLIETVFIGDDESDCEVRSTR